jgi:hypothetical protein
MQSRLILKYISSFAMSGIFKLKPDLLSHERVLSKTLFNLKILDRFVLCTSSLVAYLQLEFLDKKLESWLA